MIIYDVLCTLAVTLFVASAIMVFKEIVEDSIGGDK